MEQIILASQSPRRRELLDQAGFPFSVEAADIDENLGIQDPVAFVEELSYQKAKVIFDKYPEHTVIGADTIVVIDNQILGKPKDADDALSMLQELSGRTHQVYTGVTILRPTGRFTFHEKTDVTMFENPPEVLKNYIATGEPLDKAGAYGIQGYGGVLIEKIHGDYYNVVGLPIARIYRELHGI